MENNNENNRKLLFIVQDESLTVPQQRHVELIGREFCKLMADKYIKGQKEHGGNLWDKSDGELLDNAIDEAIDQVVYLLTIRARWPRVRG